MSLIRVRVDENSRWKRNSKNKKITKQNKQRQESKGDRSYSERVRAKRFCCAFKLSFLQLICKVSLTFKSHFELALSIILKQRELYESKHVAVECRCLKIWDLLKYVILFDMLLNLNAQHNHLALFLSL